MIIFPELGTLEMKKLFNDMNTVERYVDLSISETEFGLEDETTFKVFIESDTINRKPVSYLRIKANRNIGDGWLNENGEDFFKKHFPL